MIAIHLSIDDTTPSFIKDYKKAMRDVLETATGISHDRLCNQRQVSHNVFTCSDPLEPNEHKPACRGHIHVEGHKK